MRSSFNHPDPSEYQTPIVDSRIGNAYKTVKFVHDNFAVLKELVPGATRQQTVTGTTWLKGQVVELDLPADISMNQVQGSEVTVRDQNFVLQDKTSGYWSTTLAGGKLKFTLLSHAPIEMQNSPIFWLITYGLAT